MFSKWSAKKKAAVITSLVLVCAVSAGILYYILKPAPGDAVILTNVYSGNVTQTLDATATVESANPGVFGILDGTKVKKVYVRVGDKIKKGEILATFDPSSLQSMITDKQKAYNSAYEAYRNFEATAKKSSNDLININKQVAALEKEIAVLQAKVAAQGGSTSAGSTSADAASIANLTKLLSSILGGSSSTDQITAFINRLLSSGNSISQINSLISSILNGGSSSGFDLSSLTGLTGDAGTLTTKQLELLQLKAQQTVLKTQTNNTIETTYKSLFESAKDALVSTKVAVEQLRTGWIAKNDGIVRDVKITAGQVYKSTSAINTNFDITTLLNALTANSQNADLIKMIEQFLKPSSDGMLVEYYPFAASFILGKYDVLKVSMDQPAKITAANGSVFNGEITYISPVASSSSSINISSLLGSSSGSSNGVEAKVSIPNPDAGVIIGFDVDVSIDVDKAIGATLVPAEAIQFDSDGSYVFIYNSEKGTVTRSKVKTGIFSGSLYQILSGCKVGDTIIKAPSLTLKDGDKVTVQTTELVTTV